MGFLGRLGNFVSSTVAGSVRGLGHFAHAGLKKIGVFKSSYDAVNNSLKGFFGHALESIPVVGPVLKTLGGFLNDKSTMRLIDNTLKHAEVYSQDIGHIGRRISRLGGGAG